MEWFSKKEALSPSSQLSTPLLPHGTDDDVQPTSSQEQQQRETTAAAAYAVAHAPPIITRARSSRLTGRRSSVCRQKLHRIQDRTSHMSRQLSNVSASDYSDDITYQIHNRSTRRTYSDMYKRTISTESEITDYGEEHPATTTTYNLYGQPTNTQTAAGIIDDEEDDIPKQTMSSGTMVKVAVVLLTTACGIGSYLAAFVSSIVVTASTTESIVVGIAGGVTIFMTTPLVWVGEWRLSQMPTLRYRVNRMRDLAKRFRRELEILIMEEEELREEVEDLKENNERLEQVVKANGGNVDELVSLVQENQVLLRQMKENIRQVVLQDVVKLVLQSDIDRDGVISKREATILAKRLSINLEIYGIVFDTDKFYRAVGLSPSVCGVLGIVKRLLPPEYSVDGSDDDIDDDMDEDDEDEDDIYDMFYVPVERETLRGCADSIALAKECTEIHGERPSLISICPNTTRKSVHGGMRVSVSPI